MAGLIDATARALLDHLFSDPPYVPPQTYYAGLSPSMPTIAGTGFVEPDSGGYVRLATTGADWSPAEGSTPTQKTNTKAFVWPMATEDWADGANLVACGLFDAATEGNLVVCAAIRTPKAVLAGDTAVCNPGRLVIVMAWGIAPAGAGAAR